MASLALFLPMAPAPGSLLLPLLLVFTEAWTGDRVKVKNCLLHLISAVSVDSHSFLAVN